MKRGGRGKKGVKRHIELEGEGFLRGDRYEWAPLRGPSDTSHTEYSPILQTMLGFLHNVDDRGRCPRPRSASTAGKGPWL